MPQTEEVEEKLQIPKDVSTALHAEITIKIRGTQ